MLRRGLGRLLARQRAHPQQQPIAAAGGRLLAWPQQQQLQQLQQPTRGFRHHEGGWWEVRCVHCVWLRIVDGVKSIDCFDCVCEHPGTDRPTSDRSNPIPFSTPLSIQRRTKKQDHDEGGVVAAEPVERNPEAYRSLLSYVSDARKEEIYRLHKLDPQVC